MQKKIQELLLFLVFFIFGFGWAKLYVPTIFFYAIIYNSKAISWKMSLLCWTNYSATLFFILYTYLLGLEHMSVDSPIGTFAVVIFLALIVIPIFNTINFEFSINLLAVFLIGIFIYVLCVVVYTFLTIQTESGFRSLSSPFFPELEFATPPFSNYLAIVFCGFLYPSLTAKGLTARFISYSILILSLLMAISLGGRTFFLVAFISVVGLLFRLRTAEIFFRSFLFFTVFFVVVYYLHIEYPLFFQGLISKLDDGLASSRYEHWFDALQKIPSHPFGGFSVNQQIEEIHSFHNVFFDAARLSGWLSVFLLVIIFVINGIIFFAIRKSNTAIHYLWHLSFAVALVMMQDVILEGTYKLLILYTLLNHIIIRFDVKSVPVSLELSKQ